MKNKEHIEYGNYYHIYNRGINRQQIFRQEADYLHFLKLMSIYLNPVANLYAYALMGNHFHLALSIKQESEIGYLSSKNYNSSMEQKWKVYFPKTNESFEKEQLYKKPIPTNMLQHFLNSYAKWFNNKYFRTGSLMEHNFKRIKIEDERYFRKLIIYIHQNPIHHNISDNLIAYKWTSFMSLISSKPTKLDRSTVIEWFENRENFISVHNKNDDLSDINNFLFE